ncbi:Cobalamin synthesis protein [Candidatus Glomeribacter gigasporarum BEG34]|uniref:Cobalamin synthesis protein n=1 Tax=Candidatus Glomeribacter gigasporarum BEG34 TaxID=1070319 RepID=G2JAL1_9BURK|nr:GTP-binding protein [Candidatus Glomeribacter gigasporarum]CCD29813.1 Cobalamin synthesis protein [Candidatus Glomeribacter gigasporarum BEG34]
MIQLPLPITIVTGFLGAGKTTLLSNLLRETKKRRLAIVVNEFGEASIDGALLRDDSPGDRVQVQDVANGLLAYGEDRVFMPLMAQLHARRALIDHVVIETSGLAAPSAVMERLQSDDVLAERFVLDASLAIVDTPLLLAGQFDASASDAAANSIADLFCQQLSHADIVVLNKIDGLDKHALIEAETRIRALAPSVRFIELAYQARLESQLTLGLHLHTAAQPIHAHRQPTSTQASSGLSRPLDGHSHSGLAPHLHGLTTHTHFHEHDPGWQSFVLNCPQPQNEAALMRALAQVSSDQAVMRVKGFVYIEGACRPLLVQGVRTRIRAYDEPRHIAHSRASPCNNQAQQSPSELVFIGYHINRESVAETLRRFTTTDWH